MRGKNWRISFAQGCAAAHHGFPEIVHRAGVSDSDPIDRTHAYPCYFARGSGLAHVPIEKTFVTRGHSPSKTGVRRPDDPRVHLFRQKDGLPGQAREPRFQWPLAGAASRPMTINTLVSGLSLSGLRRALAVRLDFVQGGRASGMNALSRATRGDGIPRASRQIATTRETAPAL